MATAELRVVEVEDRHDEPQRDNQPLHRISKVRQQQRLSLRSAARRLGKDMATIRYQENEFTDLRLSDLYDWQEALEVPIADLLEDQGAPLSRPVMERARMVRLMKTATAVLERAECEAVRRMAQMLVDQLIEIMPELEDVTPWHAVGQRRSLDEYGRIADNPIPEHFFGSASNME